MKITRSQKCYIAALGVGLCALVADQVWGGGSASSTVAEVMEAVGMTGPASAALPADAHSADPATAAFNRNLADQMAALAASRPLPTLPRDGFIPDPSWISQAAASRGATSEQTTAFQHAHVLKAIINGHGRVEAMVDSSLVAVGQSFDGFVLVRAGGMRAVFRDGVNQVELKLPASDTSAIASVAP